jgi:hypothetical protein
MDRAVRGQRLEETLAELVYDRAARASDARLAALDGGELDECAAAVRRMIAGRAHRGSGSLRAWYPRTIAAWLAAHPDDGALDALLTRFCASPASRAWREPDGAALEEALYRFFDAAGVGDADVREDEFLGAIVRALAVTPRAAFVWPAEVRSAPGGCFAVTRAGVLHAALDGRYVRGPVTPLIAALLRGEPPRDDAAAAVAAQLRAMRLLT